ncbi:MAG TPA: APC family permease [Solirubrobacteraceae bacterium]|nr:APC family permease [Solirubrobacteraceae bacterium]
MSDTTTDPAGAPVTGRRLVRPDRRGLMPGAGARPRAGKHAEGGHDLDVPRGLAALSLDALTSVAYGPEAIMIVLFGAGVSALRFTLPLILVITGMLVLLIISYSQVIVAHPDGGGAYAVSKSNLGRWPALLAAASLVVDYVLTVAVSLAAGAASLGSAFPSLAHHLVLVSLAGLVLLTAINMFGISESAKVLMVPAAIFILSVLAVIFVGLVHPHVQAVIGRHETPTIVEGVGLVLILKAFASGCSAVTGVEAIANGVPAFRRPRARTAQRTEVALGLLLGIMLIGLAVLIHMHHTEPRGGVTVLAQLTAASMGTGWTFYVSNLAVALALGLAANTSFGGLPVLMSLLAKDHRLPHAFYLRSERPVYRIAIVALAFAALLLLVASGAETNNLIPLFAIGVFIGFTLCQVGLVRHWRRERGSHWRLRMGVNGAGAVMTATAVVVLLGTKFLEGAWVIVIAVPALILLFHRTEVYYDAVGQELQLGRTPPLPCKRESIVIVPTSTVNLLTEEAVSVAMSLGETVVALAVAADEEEKQKIERAWAEWKCGPPIEVIIDKHRSLIRTVLKYVASIEDTDAVVTVLIPEIVPRKRRHEILHNQRGRLLSAVLRARTDVIVATLPFKLHD